MHPCAKSGKIHSTGVLEADGDGVSVVVGECRYSVSYAFFEQGGWRIGDTRMSMGESADVVFDATIRVGSDDILDGFVALNLKRRVESNPR